MLELAPWLLLGLAVAGAMEVVLPEGWVQKQLRGRGGVTKAVLFGIPLPLCSCSVIPVGLNLKKPETGSGPAVGFLISTPQTGIDSIFVTASMLGWPFALFKMATALVTGVLGGWIESAIEENELKDKDWELPESMPSSFTPLSVIEEAPAEEPHTHQLPHHSVFVRAFLHAEAMMLSIYKWLMVGVVISVFLTLWLDGQPLDSLSGHSLLVAMSIALVISLPWYVCATESVPIAAALAVAGLPLGAIMVFLMAGPATNMATIGALWRGLGARSTIVYLITIIVGSFVGGLLFEMLGVGMKSVISLDPHAGHDHGHGGGTIGTISAVLMMLWLVRLVWLDYSGKGHTHSAHAHH